MINVSDTAKDKVQNLMEEDGFNPNTDFVRVGVKSGAQPATQDATAFAGQKFGSRGTGTSDRRSYEAQSGGAQCQSSVAKCDASRD